MPQVTLPEPSLPVRTQLPQNGGTLGKLECDKDGAVYLQPQFVSDTGGNVLPNSDILRINSDGSTNRFSAAGQGRMNYVQGHAVDRDGRVFLLTMRPGPRHRLTVLQLAADSSYVSKVDLDRELQPTLFAVLPGGEFLVGGARVDSDENRKGGTSVLWLFGSDGSFHREFGAATPTKGDKPGNPVGGPSSPDLGGLQIGDDDNIYVLRPGSPAKVNVFDQGGTLQRTLRLDAPPKAALDGFFSARAGRLVVGYSSPQQKVGPPSPSRIFRVYDPQTGIAQIDYVSAFAGTPACVDNNDLIFLLTGKDGSLNIARVSMR